MSQSPDPRSRGNLLFALRALFGVNARAEIMAWLLSHDSGHPAAIARSTGYFSKSIQQTLNEMEESGQVISVRQGREKMFRVRAQDWRFLAPVTASDGDSKPFPRWVDWMPLSAAITRFAETLALPVRPIDTKKGAVAGSLIHYQPTTSKRSARKRTRTSTGYPTRSLV